MAEEEIDPPIFGKPAEYKCPQCGHVTYRTVPPRKITCVKCGYTWDIETRETIEIGRLEDRQVKVIRTLDLDELEKRRKERIRVERERGKFLKRKEAELLKAYEEGLIGDEELYEECRFWRIPIIFIRKEGETQGKSSDSVLVEEVRDPLIRYLSGGY